MRTRQLKSFIVLAEELHFGKAAERLHMQQPPLSRQIKALENELEVMLFKRNNRKVELTEEGAFFLQEAKAIITRLTAAQHTLKAMGNGEAGTLRIGFVDSSITERFVITMGRFKDQYPKVIIELEEKVSVEQVAAIGEGSLHIGFIRTQLAKTHELSHINVINEPYIIALANNHPMAEQETVSVYELAKEPLIFFPHRKNPGFYNWVLNGFAQYDLMPKFGFEVERDQAAEMFVAGGFGYTLLPSTSCRMGRRGLTYKRIQEPFLDLRISMAWNPAHECPLVNNFIDVFKQQAG
ncbi:LysR family transcriptional regulator [Halodesulfovibrio spirochaetisodalis]|uniref:HTH lysR-type domain-containing protein n=1 Tax=Halodesulfovibrio spirochaetisodalis TaxID=1560234 RepID=A0A1B7XML9_9BACT|nr:LysR family transcriptional regulator [Halodesulfovibrio spirochaetisodalis]OBQ56751.1 hypothetical protein SP90_01305 [Halodesulfovibrio spirochaetisodalis]